jgi:hypothetical protein
VKAEYQLNVRDGGFVHREKFVAGQIVFWF